MKVLVNGCSHIEGTELAVESEVGKTLSWPNFVTGWNVTNIANASSSNDSITRRTIDELESNEYDFVFVQWSYFDRIELQIPFYQDLKLQYEWFCINGGNAQIKSSLNNNPEFIFELARSIYLKQFNTQWFENYNLSSIITLQNYLDSKNIFYKFGFAGPKKFNFDNARGRLLKQHNFLEVSWEEFCQSRKFKKLQHHYEQKSHYEYAQYIDFLQIKMEST